jgi:hypothetical protein
MSLSSKDVGLLQEHLTATNRALGNLPKSEAITAALATVQTVAKAFESSPHGDAQAALSSVTAAADSLARYAVANTAQASVEAVIKPLRKVADLLRKANEPGASQ